MNNNRQDKLQKISRELAKQPEVSGLSLKGILEKLPNWALVPLTVVVFGLLLTDTAIADPLPFVDEAALFYALVSSIRVLGGRRRAKKELQALLEDADPEFVVDLDELSAPPGQPATVPTR